MLRNKLIFKFDYLVAHCALLFRIIDFYLQKHLFFEFFYQLLTVWKVTWAHLGRQGE